MTTSMRVRPCMHSILRFFVNGEWHAVHTTGPPASAPVCEPGQPQTDIDIGSMYTHFPNSTDASCCAACQAAPRACNAWARVIATDPTFPLDTCILYSGGRGVKPASSRTSHVIDFSAPAIGQITGTLKMKAPPSAGGKGSDRFGSYVKTSTEWLATSSKGATAAFNTSFRVYADGRTIVLEQEIAGGAKGTAFKNVTFADGMHSQLATLEPHPFLQFPSFNVSHPDSIFARPGQAGFTTWQGTMVRIHGPFSGAPTTGDLGLSSGPVVVHDGLTNGGSNHAVVVSPATHFKGATMLRWEDDWTVGMSGEITEVPVGFKHETVLVAGNGVTATMDYYGRAMRAAHKVKKIPDRVVETVGYWTDNGAYYYGDAYPQLKDVPGDTHPEYNLTCCTSSKLLAAKSALDRDKVPISYLQLDDWWYFGPKPVEHFTGGVKCVGQWRLPEDTYPGGLDALRKAYGAPFLLYGPYFCAENQWNQSLWPVGADAGVPPPEESRAFYDKVFRYARLHGAVGYEVDFMSNLFLGVPEFRRSLDASTLWQSGMNQAALALQPPLPIQWCMMQPSDLLSSLQFDSVTNGRASYDYAEGDNWNVGGSSLLFWAVGVRPSKDNFWSSDGQKRQPGFTQSNPGTNGELNAILAVMTRGPVGPSDGAGQHNVTRLLRTCAADGTILQPERPMTPIDATFRQVLSSSERQLRSGAVWSTFSQSHSQSSTETTAPAQYHILGVDVNATAGAVPVLATDMYPTPPSGAQFAVRDWHRQAQCKAGADAVESGCVRLVRHTHSETQSHTQRHRETQDGAPLVELGHGISWPFGTHTMQLHTATVLQPGKLTLLGELDKFVPLSSKRFSAVNATAGRLTALLSGGAGVVVHVTGLRPSAGGSWEVVRADVAIDASGVGRLVL